MNIIDPACISRWWLHDVGATQIYILPKINITEDAVKIISYINFKKQGLKVQGEGICVAWQAYTSYSIRTWRCLLFWFVQETAQLMTEAPAV
jgi:hypothetical protein